MTRRLSTATSPTELEPTVSLATNAYPLGSSFRAHEGSRASVERGLQAPATMCMAANSPQGQIGGQEGDTRSSATHTDCFTISEWILATPLTAWDPITHRWAMLIRLQSPSSIADILRRRSTSPGNRAATCCCQDTQP